MSKQAKQGVKVIRILSFGYKHPAPPPQDAALVIDCRGFINPHYDLKLRPKTGESKAVADYLKADPEVQALLAALTPLIQALLPGLLNRSAYHPEVKLAFGCTGGKHRSRFLAITAGGIVRDLLAQHPEWHCKVVVNHRDRGLD